MQLRERGTFLTIHTEGSILPTDLLQRIDHNDRDLGGLTPDAYHLDANERLNEAINRSWNRLIGAWVGFRSAIDKLPVGELGTAVTRERWLLPLFQELGFGRLLTARASEIEGKSYPISHGWNHSPIHLVGFRVDLDRRTAGVAGAARLSPHGLVQEFLNKSDEHRWGFASNGLRLRILRDNTSLTRQAYVEFDLEAMMNGEGYADFVLLWLLCHQSRVEADKPDDCWLEKWSRAAQEQGTRFLDQLRNGVEAAITALAGGFLSHPANQTLRSNLRSGALSTQDYYRETLRLVYRLLFLFVAEDRDLLLNPEADGVAKGRFTRFYSTSRLRHLAERRRGSRHADLYQGLRLVIEKLGSKTGCTELGLPALGSFLFSRDAAPNLEGCEIANHDFLEALRSLAFTIDGHTRRRVDYKNLGAEELGSVYESLLELHPLLNLDAGTFELKVAGGNERKTTGSYYTPETLVQCLLDSALDPVLDEAARKADAEVAILKLKVCDPACGSGHFLIAAAHRIARRLASVRTGEDEPSPKEVRRALRDVVGHCLYGVDINPMAVELCKVNLWLEALEPGKPLSFLDHRIQCGNSLIGTTPTLVEKGIPDEAFTPIEGDEKANCSEFKKRNKKEREGHRSFWDAQLQPWQRIGDLATSMMNLDDLADDTIDDVQRKQERYESLVRSTGYLYGRFLADTWCAAFVWKKNKEFPYPITEQVFRKVEQNPYDIAPWMRDEIKRLAEQYQFFHWHIAFPDVFRVPGKDGKPENEQAGWSGGFDVVLGNPPWERFKLQEKEWFATRRPDISSTPNASQRRRLIGNLALQDPSLYAAFLDAHRQGESESHVVRSSGRFPLTGRGDINTYAVFAETNRLVVASTGRIGCILPSGIATDDTTKLFFQNLTDTHSLVSLYDFENREAIFPTVHRSYKFCLVTLTGCSQQPTRGSEFAFYLRTTGELRDSERKFDLSAEDLSFLNPETRTCPIFRSKRDAEITKGVYSRVPILARANSDVGSQRSEGSGAWKITLFTMFHSLAAAHLFLDESTLPQQATRQSNYWIANGKIFLPLYEGKMFHQFDHRFAGVKVTNNLSRPVQPVESNLSQHMDPIWLPEARSWVDDQEIDAHRPHRTRGNWFLGFKDVTAGTNERTLLATVLPRCAIVDSVNVIGIDEAILPSKTCALLGNLNSFALDYIVRQKIGGIHIKFYLLRQLPVLPPYRYEGNSAFLDAPWEGWIMPRILELVYTAWDLEAFSRDCGYSGPPFRWDEGRRALIRCELDAAYFHLSCISRDDVDYIMDTFPIVKRKDEQKYGEYRTKRVILEIYDAMQRAMETGEPYQTLLDPPPADPRVAHPPRS